jgi:hypothetical protein
MNSNIHKDCFNPLLLKSQNDLNLFAHLYLTFKEQTDQTLLRTVMRYESVKSIELQMERIISVSKKFKKYFELLRKRNELLFGS